LDIKPKKVQLSFESINAIDTIKDQSARVEKISIVVHLSKEQKKTLMNVYRKLKENDRDFYLNNNLHVTVLGLGLIKRTYYGTIEKEIKEFSKRNQKLKLTVTFDTVRPGTFYLNDRRTDTITGLSNGTVVALGDIRTNKEFHPNSNQLSSFPSNDNKLKPVLQSYFRKKLPLVWCTMGYYNKPGTFRISEEIESLLNNI